MKRKYIIGIVLVVLLCPLIVNAMMFIPCKWASGDNPWIGFWGSFLGAIVSSCAAFIILYLQRKDNRRENTANRSANKQENEKNRALQLKEIKNRQDSAWLSELKNAVLETLSVYSPHNVTSIIDNLLQNDFSQQEKEIIQNETKGLLNQIIQADTSVGMSVASHLTDNIVHYNRIRNEMYNKTCGTIKDIQVISIVIFCIENDRKYSRRIITECYSKELGDIIEQYDHYALYAKVEEFIKQMRKDYCDSFERFRESSIDCIVSENNRISKELSV